MALDITLDRQVATLRVEELVALIRQTVREELSGLLSESINADLPALPPPLRDPDAVIGKMQATGKYNKKFLASLRKGMMRSQAFQTAQVGSEA